jgi:hypothetical protein
MCRENNVLGIMNVTIELFSELRLAKVPTLQLPKLNSLIFTTKRMQSALNKRV